MGLFFRNGTSKTVFIVIAHPDNCDDPGLRWKKRGWYHVAPGQEVKVWSGWAGGRYFEYYAEDDFGSRWSGTHFTDIPDEAFEWCWNTGCSTCRNLGLKAIPIGRVFDMDYTIGLAP